MTHTIQSISNDSRSMNETNDCTVRALVATTGCTYQECHEALRLEGRKNRKGAWRGQWENAANRLGFFFVDVTRSIPGRTIRTASRSLPRGRKFIMQVRGHVAGWNGQEVLDWAKGRQHRIQNIVEVKPMSDSVREEPALPPVVARPVVKPFTPRKVELFINFTHVKNDRHFRMMKEYEIFVPPARVNREKWARENARTILSHGQTGVIELKGDAAVNYRKKYCVRGKVFMIFGYKAA